jgi:DNA mismatch repair protein MutL
VQKLNRNSIYIFVNGRLIRDRVLLKAISSAYYNLIPPGCFPFALLFLDLPFEEVDVNVHPSKTEVRFQHHSVVHDFVRDSLRERLIASKPISTFPVPAELRTAQAQPATSLPYSEASLMLSEADVPADTAFGLQAPAAPPRRFDFGASPPIDFQRPASSIVASPFQAGASPMPHGGGDPALSPSQLETVEAAAEEFAALPIDSRPHGGAPLADLPPDTLANLGQLRPLGQIRDSFIVASSADGLWIIDQHVAHERILFEQVLRQRARGTVESQRLLMPIIVTLKPDQEIKFAQIEEEFRANGFDIEPFGQRTVAVKAAPAGLSPQNVETLLHEILDTPERELRELSLSDLQRRVAATIACHAAIKVNMPLDLTKMHWLLDQLAKSEFPMACPHGRPIALKYSLREILKAFHRI